MISVYADGSSTGRSDGPGGYGFVVLYNGKPVASGNGGEPLTTNNVMELAGIKAGLLAVDYLIKTGKLKRGLLEVVSDSQYALGVGSGSYAATKNVELVESVQALAKQLNVTRWRWVRGHDNEKWNERCDSLAKLGKNRAREEHAAALVRKVKDAGAAVSAGKS